MFKIAKEFEFDYSHRVFVQDVNPELSLTNCNKCRFPHGHRGRVLIHLTAEALDDKGMVFDFVNLNFVKKFIDDVLDHKCILSIQDPSLPIFYPLFKNIHKKFVQVPIEDDYLQRHPELYWTIKPEYYLNLSSTEQEIYEGLVFVNFVPTSENLSKWLFDIVQKKLEGYATVSQVQFFETPKSQSNYFPE